MLPLLGPNGTSWPWPMQRIPSGRACWPGGIHRFDYEEGQRCFSSFHIKGVLFFVETMEPLRGLWNWPYFVQSFKPLIWIMFLCLPPHLQIYLHLRISLSSSAPSVPTRFTLAMKMRGIGNYFDGEGSKITWYVGRKMLGLEITLAVWLLLFELK